MTNYSLLVISLIALSACQPAKKRPSTSTTETTKVETAEPPAAIPPLKGSTLPEFPGQMPLGSLPPSDPLTGSHSASETDDTNENESELVQALRKEMKEMKDSFTKKINEIEAEKQKPGISEEKAIELENMIGEIKSEQSEKDSEYKELIAEAIKENNLIVPDVTSPESEDITGGDVVANPPSSATPPAAVTLVAPSVAVSSPMEESSEEPSEPKVKSSADISSTEQPPVEGSIAVSSPLETNVVGSDEVSPTEELVKAVPEVSINDKLNEALALAQEIEIQVEVPKDATDINQFSIVTKDESGEEVIFEYAPRVRILEEHKDEIIELLSNLHEETTLTVDSNRSSPVKLIGVIVSGNLVDETLDESTKILILKEISELPQDPEAPETMIIHEEGTTQTINNSRIALQCELPIVDGKIVLPENYEPNCPSVVLIAPTLDNSGEALYPLNISSEISETFQSLFEISAKQKAAETIKGLNGKDLETASQEVDIYGNYIYFENELNVQFAYKNDDSLDLLAIQSLDQPFESLDPPAKKEEKSGEPNEDTDPTSSREPLPVQEPGSEEPKSEPTPTSTDIPQETAYDIIIAITEKCNDQDVTKCTGKIKDSGKEIELILNSENGEILKEMIAKIGLVSTEIEASMEGSLNQDETQLTVTIIR